MKDGIFGSSHGLYEAVESAVLNSAFLQIEGIEGEDLLNGMWVPRPHRVDAAFLSFTLFISFKIIFLSSFLTSEEETLE